MWAREPRKLRKLCITAPGTHSQFVLVLGTSVGFTVSLLRRNFTLEQFWGRAVRASQDSNESLGRFLFGAEFSWNQLAQVSVSWFAVTRLS